MTQFVEQLRNQAKWYAQPGHNARDLMDSHLLEKAADEIECLRAEVIYWKEQKEPGAAGWRAIAHKLRAKITEMEKQEPSVPREVIEKMLTQLMDIAVSNGANSISMPDEYVEVAAWLCGIPAQHAPSVPEGASFIDTNQLEGVVSTEIVHSYPPPSGWLRAIDEALVVTHLGVANASDTYEQAKAKLDSLLGFHVDVATDPAVNGGWKLVPVELVDLYNFMCAAFVPMTPQQEQIAIQLELAKRAMLAAAPEAKP